jgi:hypothetical protein
VNARAKLDDLVQAVEFDSDFADFEQYFDRKTGRIVMVEKSTLDAAGEDDGKGFADFLDGEREKIELARAVAADDGSRFIEPPGKFEFHEYRHMERFIGTIDDEATREQLARAIKGRGAFRYFKDTLHRLGIQDRWHRYRDEALKKFMLDWAEENWIEVDTGDAK